MDAARDCPLLARAAAALVSSTSSSSRYPAGSDYLLSMPLRRSAAAPRACPLLARAAAAWISTSSRRPSAPDSPFPMPCRFAAAPRAWRPLGRAAAAQDSSTWSSSSSSRCPSAPGTLLPMPLLRHATACTRSLAACSPALRLPPVASSRYPAVRHAALPASETRRGRPLPPPACALSGSTFAGTTVVRALSKYTHHHTKGVVDHSFRTRCTSQGSDGVTKQPKSEKKLHFLVGCVFILVKLADLKAIRALLPERMRTPDKADAILGAIFILGKVLYGALKDTKEFCELIHYVRELCKKEDTA